jgi:hypothetical protein
MKVNWFVPLAATALLFAGCIVTSVYPYYTEKDVVFDSALLGKWADVSKTNSTEAWSFDKTDERTYKLTLLENGKQSAFDTRLFKLKGQAFLDCLPRDRGENSMPVHYLLRVDALAQTLEIRLLNYDWLWKFVGNNPKAIKHIIVPVKVGETGGKGDLVLTADTAELQKFILQYLKTGEAWSGRIVLKKESGK